MLRNKIRYFAPRRIENETLMHLRSLKRPTMTYPYTIRSEWIRKVTNFTLSFAYKSIDMRPTDNNHYFYLSARGIDNTEFKGWTSWNECSSYQRD